MCVCVCVRAHACVQDQVDALVERKEQLKQELKVVEEATDQWKNKYRSCDYHVTSSPTDEWYMYPTAS